MFTLQVHRNAGSDEDFEYETEAEAYADARTFWASDDDVRRLVLADETGRVVDERTR